MIEQRPEALALSFLLPTWTSCYGAVSAGRPTGVALSVTMYRVPSIFVILTVIRKCLSDWASS